MSSTVSADGADGVRVTDDDDDDDDDDDILSSWQHVGHG